jgi:hypothetical protein
MNNRELKAKIVLTFGSQIRFAEAVGSHENRVSKVITGRSRPTDHERQTWAKALKANPESLFAE